MLRSVKAAGFVRLQNGRFYHPKTGAYGKLYKRSFRICRSRPRTRNGKAAVNRRSLKPLEELWQVFPGDGMAKLIRGLVTECIPKLTPTVTPELLERMSDRLRCGSNVGVNRGRNLKRSRPSYAMALGWNPKRFPGDERTKIRERVFG